MTGKGFFRRVFLSIPSQWEADYWDYQRLLARRIGVTAAVGALLILPAFQIIEYFLYESPHEVGLRNALWRIPVVLPALAILWLRVYRPNAPWPRPLLLLLSFTLMAMMVGIFVNDQLFDGPPIQYASQGLIITMAVISVMATRGLRDLILVLGLPLSALPWVALHQGLALNSVAINLIYPGLMLFVAALIAELLHHGYRDNFLATQKLRRTAMTDPLTGLFNRRAMEDELKAAQAHASRQNSRYALIMADLDFFKRVNDHHGHEVGDQVLKELAERLQQSIRVDDRVARWGGEEFLILVQDTNEQGALEVAEKIRRAVADTPFKTDAGELAITISLGVALGRESQSPEETSNLADQALYQAKGGSRNQSVLRNL